MFIRILNISCPHLISSIPVNLMCIFGLLILKYMQHAILKYQPVSNKILCISLVWRVINDSMVARRSTRDPILPLVSSSDARKFWIWGRSWETKRSVACSWRASGDEALENVCCRNSCSGLRRRAMGSHWPRRILINSSRDVFCVYIRWISL